MSSTSSSAHKAGTLTQGHKKVIFASSLGTVFEWYDFFLYGSLAAIIAKQFFSGVNETTGMIFALLAFAAGFFVRPFGAAFFGSLGDRIGRKYTFLVTILIMGISTFLVGVLPNYASIGFAAPVILIILRLAQGLAMGGEYGGAATYVAEHAPEDKRGLYTSFIQCTATLGLFMSLLIILACRYFLGNEAFEAWGWRIPFLVSILLLGISVWIRLQLSESPLFQQMKSEGKGSKTPFRDSLKGGNLKLMLLVLLGAAAGQAVVWYGGQFYALFFLSSMLKVDATTSYLLIAAALALGVPDALLRLLDAPALPVRRKALYALSALLRGSDEAARRVLAPAGAALAALESTTPRDAAHAADVERRASAHRASLSQLLGPDGFEAGDETRRPEAAVRKDSDADMRWLSSSAGPIPN